MSSTGQRYLDTRQAAAYLGLSPKTLHDRVHSGRYRALPSRQAAAYLGLIKMRITGEGPRYAKVGRRVIYDMADLDAWVEERKI